MTVCHVLRADSDLKRVCRRGTRPDAQVLAGTSVTRGHIERPDVVLEAARSTLVFELPLGLVRFASQGDVREVVVGRAPPVGGWGRGVRRGELARIFRPLKEGSAGAVVSA